MVGKMAVTLVVTLAAMGLICPAVPTRAASAEMIGSVPVGEVSRDAKLQMGQQLVKAHLIANGCEVSSATGFAGALSAQELAFIADNPQVLQNAGNLILTSVCGVFLFVLVIVLVFMETGTQEETGEK